MLGSEYRCRGVNIRNAWFNYQFSEFNTEIVKGYVNNINLIKENDSFKKYKRF